jgi:two-component system CheB/CheR fusion protein
MPERPFLLTTNGNQVNETLDRNDPSSPRFPVVGVGASAGGPAALKRLLQGLPEDPGMAVVVVTHAWQPREDGLRRMLASSSSMPVVTAEAGMRVEANTVYAPPPGESLELEDGELRPASGSSPTDRYSIDQFLRSLARDMGERAFCVILSGAGMDGSRGLREVKAAGGVAVVQSEDSAGHPSMPASAAATGVADAVLPVEEIPAALTSFAERLQDMQASLAPDAATETLERILGRISATVGQDFSGYKRKTLLRRIEKRMALAGRESLEEYALQVESDELEAEALYRQLLIQVTSFFRDPEVYQALEERVIPAIFAEKGSQAPVRIWAAGCSSGEEAYSLAMLVKERMECEGVNRPVQIFATDVDEKALAAARRGVYPPSIVQEAGPDRVERHFRKTEDGLKVDDGLRKMILFAAHDLLRDPPFFHLDLILCRNLLIYLKPEHQQTLLRRLFHALEPEGRLVLGPSESGSRVEGVFRVEDKKARIYQRGAGDGWSAERFTEAARLRTPVQANRPAGALVQQRLLERYAHPAVLVNERREALHFHGDTSAYLGPPKGPPTNNVLKLVRESLRAPLRTIIQKAFAEKRSVTLPESALQAGEGERLRIAAEYVPDDAVGGLCLVVFEQAPDDQPQSEGPEDGRGQSVERLEEELHQTREQLQSVIEELEASNEELETSNDELTAMNQELQSSNEELVVSKRELRDLNRELVSVNAELESKVEELKAANSDIENLFASSDVAVVFLDRELKVKRFTPAASDVFSLVEADAGRPLDHLSTSLDYPELFEDARGVLRDLGERSREVRAGERWYTARIFPYRTVDDRIEGVVLTFQDVTGVKRSELEARRSRERYKVLTGNFPHGAVMLLDADLRFAVAAGAGFEAAGEDPESYVDHTIFEVFDPETARAMEEPCRAGLAGERRVFEMRYRDRFYEVWVEPLPDQHGGAGLVQVLTQDVTETRESLRKLHERQEAYRALVENNPDVIFRLDRNGVCRYVNQAIEALTGRAAEKYLGKPLEAQRLPASLAQRIRSGLDAACRQGEEASFEAEVDAAGEHLVFQMRVCPEFGPSGRPKSALCVARDITEINRLRRESEEARRRAERANRAKGEFLANMSHEIRTPLGAVLGLADMALGRTDDAETSRLLGLVKGSANSLLVLVNDILDLSRIEAGKLEIKPEAFELRERVGRTMGLFAFEADRKGLELHWEIDPQCPEYVHCDPERLAQVLKNLLSNAIKFTQEGEVRVSVRPNRSDEAPGNLLAEVRDTGPGVPEEHQERLFRKFTQLDSSYSKTYGGTGLGLAICRSLAEMMGGAIWLESREGRGSSFFFTVQAEPARAGDLSPQEAEESEAPDMPSCRILLAEDNRVNQIYLKHFLSDAGHECVVAEDGRQAVDMARDQCFDIVLMDVQMPELDGLEATRELRSSTGFATRPDTPVIALTAYAMKGDRERFLSQGMDDYVTKPVDWSRLFAKMARLMRR